MTKYKFFLKELERLQFSIDKAEIIKKRMIAGLSIMTKAEITQTLEDYKITPIGNK